MITKFDRQTAKALSAEIETALAAIAAKHGLTIAAAGGTIGTVSLKLKFECKVNDPAASAKQERDTFNVYAAMFGLRPEHFGATFQYKRQVFRLIGILPNRPKFPLRAMNVETGKELLFPQQMASKISAREAVLNQ